MSDMDTTALDGAACVICGDDSVWCPTIAEGSRLADVPLCGACSDDETTICAGVCGSRIWQKDGVRIGEDLHCASCAQLNPNVASCVMEALKRDDLFNRR